MTQSVYLTANAAANLLDVQKDTLYAYVSRGLLRSVDIPGKRSRGYLKEDIERLLQRKRLRQAPETEIKQALHWGIPLLSTQISQIKEGQLYYRGKTLSEVLECTSLEAVLEILWNIPVGELQPVKKKLSKKKAFEFAELLNYLPQHVSWREKALLCLTTWNTVDLSHAYVAKKSAIDKELGVLQQLWGSVVPLCLNDTLIMNSTPIIYTDYFKPLLPKIFQQKIAFAVLVLAAEHELNISSFTARCIASARGNVYAALTGAFAALSGQRHGGQVLQVQQLLYSAERLGPQKAVRQVLQQGDNLPLTGHPLYPDGDPRWKAFLEIVEQQCLHKTAPKAAERFSLYLEVLKQAHNVTGHLPTLDWVLAIAAELLCPEHLDAMDWFALARIPGWLAHIREQYESPHLIRPRGERV